jgi:hypothetical protein
LSVFFSCKIIDLPTTYLAPCKKVAFTEKLHFLLSSGFASGRQVCKILQQLISYREYWAGQFIQQDKKEVQKNSW